MASFQAKIGWKMPRNRKNKKLLVCSVPTRRVVENSKKIVKNIQKIKKYLYDFLPSQNRFEKAKKERK